MDDKVERRRRPKGQAALGNVYETKKIVDEFLAHQSDERRAKTERLRALRLGNTPPAGNDGNAEGGAR